MSGIVHTGADCSRKVRPCHPARLRRYRSAPIGAAYTCPMRLSPDEQSQICAAAMAVLPAGSRLSLFGSRVDDSRRGGDVDLLIETTEPSTPAQAMQLRSRLAVQLYRRLGERRIDIVVASLAAPDTRLVVAQARAQALELIRT
jgi:uncharacterized protein